jgi:hypothetical protein
MKIRAGPQPFVQTIFIFLSAAKSNKFLGYSLPTGAISEPEGMEAQLQRLGHGG